MHKNSLPTVSIRKADYYDVQRIVDIDEKLFGEGAYPNFSVRQYIDLFPHSFFVSEIENLITGYGLVGVEALTPNAWLLSLGVLVEYQGKGLGRALTQACDDYCVSSGMEKCSLTVEPDNSVAISLYRKFGFVDVAHKKNYYKFGDERLLMEKVFVN